MRHPPGLLAPRPTDFPGRSRAPLRARRHGSRLFLLVLALFLLPPGAIAPAAPLPPPLGPAPRHLTVVMDADYPPYVFRDENGAAQGILIDTWKLWEHVTGVPVTIHPLDWNVAQTWLLQGRADVIDMLFETPEREKTYAFSGPTATIEVPVFVHKDIEGLRDAAALRDFAVGVKRGDACIERLTALGVGLLVPFDSYASLVQAAGKGTVKVFCADKPPALYFLYKFGLNHDFRLAFVLYSGQFHRAVRKDDASLLRVVDDGFSRIPSRQLMAIERKWRGESLFSLANFRYALWIVGGLTAAAAVLLAINALLRRALRRKTETLRELLDAVRQSEERYRELVESAASVIVRLDSRGRVVFCNTFAQRLFGLPEDRMLGHEFGHLTDPPGSQAAMSWQDILTSVSDSTEGTGALDRSHRGWDGRTVWIAWSIRHLGGDQGGSPAFLCVGADITARLQAAQSLAESEALYALVVRAANDGIWEWDLSTDRVSYSPRYLEILGLAPKEMEPRMEAWTSRLHPDDAEAVIDAIKRCADGERETFTVEYRLRHADGSYRHVIGRNGSLKDAAGQVVRLAGSVTDITRRKKDETALRESQDRLTKIFRHTLVGLAISTCRDGRIIEINEAGARMFGYEKDEIIGRNSADIHVWKTPEQRRSFLDTLSHAGSVPGTEMELTHKNGSSVISLVSAVPIQAYGESCILSVFVDITERKAMEQALRRAKDAAEAANRAKSEFLSTMSHEIRTPMNTILGMAAVLAEADLPPEQARALTAITLAGNNLMALLSDILDLSRIEAGGIIMQEKACDVRAMAGELVEMMRPDAARKGLDISLEIQETLPPRLFVSPDRLRQVLVNLLGNAVKFTEKGHVILELGREIHGNADPLLRLAVRDTGIGIAPEKREEIFERFTQANATASRRFGGVGLGLAICRRLVDLMGGQLRVDSTPGEGSVFTIVLPLRPAPASPEAATAPPPGDRVGHASVLLVEDSASNAEVTRLMLKNAPFDLTWAPSGEAGLALFREHPFDIVLMDMEMPGLDGYRTTESLRRLEKELGRGRTPVIALTAHAFEEDRQKGLAAGCDDFQIKPIAKARLLEVLETWRGIGPS